MGFTLCTCRTIEWESDARRRETLFNFQFMNVFGFFFHSTMMHPRCMTLRDYCVRISLNATYIMQLETVLDGNRIWCATKADEANRTRHITNECRWANQANWIHCEWFHERNRKSVPIISNGLIVRGKWSTQICEQIYAQEQTTETFCNNLIISVTVGAYKVSRIRANNLP